jgi:regulatory protein YycI of two-component signal transduction system YycFG
MKKIFLLMCLAFTIVTGIFYILPHSSCLENSDDSVTIKTKSLGMDKDINITAEIPTGVKILPYYKVINEDRVNIKNASQIITPRNSLPSEEEAIKSANDYLVSNNYLPKDAYLGKVTTQYITSVNKSSEGKITENKSPVLVEIEYYRSINGYPVSGPGDSITICVGEHNEVIYLFKTWRELELAGEVSIIDANSAIGKLEQHEIIEEEIGPGELPVEITEIELGYYSEVTGNEQEYYKPVWIFKGKDKFGNDEVMCVNAA